jgi:uncharacterized SAM-binding protein YcdF (DUF218 family)
MSDRSRIMAPVLSLKILGCAFGGFLTFTVVLLVKVRVLNTTAAAAATAGKEVHSFTSPGQVPRSVVDRMDAILVLGGGRPSSAGEPPAYVQRRCDDAAAIVQKKRSGGSHHPPLPVLCLSAGTAHLPQLLSADGLPVWEATASAAYLERAHNLSDIYVETASYDTIGNAYFARTIHTDVIGWRNLLIVTNKVRSFHGGKGTMTALILRFATIYLPFCVVLIIVTS